MSDFCKKTARERALKPVANQSDIGKAAVMQAQFSLGGGAMI